MIPRILIASVGTLVLASCGGGRELSAGIAQLVSEPGYRTSRPTDRSAPRTMPGGPGLFRVPTVTDKLPSGTVSHPGTPAGGTSSGDEPSSVSARPPAP